MLALQVEYLLGRVHAATFGFPSSPEWPPHPARLFSALAASYFEGGNDAGERKALEWLEGQHPPCIRAGVPGEAQAVTTFVPTNYPGDLVPVLRNKQPRFFAAQAPSEATVFFMWPSAEAPKDVIGALDRLAERTACLGKASSLVRMRVADSAPEPNYVPHDEGNEVLRIPSSGRLQELEALFQADRRPSAGAQQRYLNVDKQNLASVRVETEFGQMAVLRKADGPGLPIEAAVTLTQAVRNALLDCADRLGQVGNILHGHDGGPHCAIVALPFAGWPHADGRLVGFAVILPRDAQPAERRIVLAACGMLAENGLHIPGVGDWKLEPADSSAIQRTLRGASWARPDEHWSSVTPILLDRFPKKKGPTVEEILSAACQRIGLPAPIHISHGPYSPLEGVLPVPAFRLHRKSDERPRWAVHATLEFAEQVRGPMLLGAGRYFGLGLLRPGRVNRDD